MAAPTESGRSRTPDKEANSDIPSRRRGDSEQIQIAKSEILRRATLKIDFYLIPVVGMFCVSSNSHLLSLLTSKCSFSPQIFCRSW